jgi:hypothetical protein
MENPLRGPILYEKIVRMELNISIIIRGEAMDRHEAFVCTRNMKDIS